MEIALTQPTKPRVVIVAERGRSVVPAGQSILVREDVEQKTVRRASELLEAMRSALPALVLLGSDLEGADLPDLCRQIRADEKLRRTSILLVVSPMDRDLAEATHKAGANAVLYRPVTAEEFDTTVGRLLSVPARRSFRALIQFQVDVRRAGFFHLARSRNISSGGLLLESDRHLAIGERLDLRFFLPGAARETQVAAEVVRITSGPLGCQLFGLRFIDLDDRGAEAVQTYVQRRRPETE